VVPLLRPGESPDKIRDIMEVAAREAVGELIQKIPGASTFLSVVQEARRNYLEARATALLEAIAVRLGNGDLEAAARELQSNLGQPWFDEAIEAGFRTILDSVDPASWRCIGFLVAEYVTSKRKSDPTFRKVSSVLREADERALVTLKRICHAYVGLATACEDGCRVLVYNPERSGKPQPLSMWLAILKGDGSSILGSRLPRPANFEQCLRILVVARVGAPWEGLSASSFEGEPALRFDAADDDTVRLLHRCLQAIEAGSSTPTASEA